MFNVVGRVPSRTVQVIKLILVAINAASDICLTILAVSLVLQIRASAYVKGSLGILISLSLM